MGAPGIKTCSDREFYKIFKENGPQKTAEILDLNLRTIYRRRDRIEALTAGDIRRENPTGRIYIQKKIGRLAADVNGIVIVGSDAHFWPGQRSTVFRGFLKLCRELQPKIVVINGDVLDFPKISRHQSIMWENSPEVHEELEWAQQCMHEIVEATPRARRIWPLGNHDSRFETKLANIAPEYRKVAGVHLKDHFSLFEPCWSVELNGNTIVKHRYRNGEHAPRNNVMRSGMHMVTGHLHSAKVMPFTTAKETLYGVDAGCLADPDYPQFEDYTEGSPKDWRAAFCVLEYFRGRLLMPQLALAFDEDHIEFERQIIDVSEKEASRKAKAARRKGRRG